MKFWSVATPLVRNVTVAFGCVGLIALMALPVSPVHAEETAKASPASPAKTDAQAAKPAKAAKQVTVNKPVPVPKLKARPAYQGTAECLRTGQRVIAALARDDSGAASQFHTFYAAFGCSAPHLAQAFGCLVNLQASNPGLSNPSPEQVTQCWESPQETPVVHEQPSADGAGEKH